MTLPLKKSLETILFVEDNAFVMQPVVLMLEQGGFTVLSASNADQAIQVESDFAETIQLLLSDVMMPGIPGPALAKKIQQRRPQMRVILMSSFIDGAMLFSIMDGTSSKNRSWPMLCWTGSTKSCIATRPSRERTVSTLGSKCGVLRGVSGGKFCIRVHFEISRKGVQDHALDNSRNSVVVVGARDGDGQHDVRTHSHLVSRRVDCSTSVLSEKYIA